MTADNPSLTPEQQHDCERLLSKSQEAFILAIELFNRPTIRYRVEGCAFFLCNAWELMLKAYLIKRDGYESIFYPGKTQRTLSLADCIKKVMTNDKDPVRLNLESIDELRNTGTHFVVEEYEITYGPIFQANIHNYDDNSATGTASKYATASLTTILCFPSIVPILTVRRCVPNTPRK